MAVGTISYEIYLLHAFALRMIKPSIVAVFSFIVVTGTLAYVENFVVGKIKNGKFNNYYPHKK